ncbi:MAG: adenylyl-sulfate kinase [Cyanobacteria bacterium P01_C01_bin.72]
MKQQGVAVWFTGFSGAGKSTIADALTHKLKSEGYQLEVLDGDEIREHLTKDLGFSQEDRNTNIRRIGFVAKLLARNGVIVLVPVISPYRSIREEMRASIGSFMEVFVNAPISVCEERDVKGLYKQVRAGKIKQFTGIDDPYEPPTNPEVECRTDLEELSESVDKIFNQLKESGYIS